MKYILIFITTFLILSASPNCTSNLSMVNSVDSTGTIPIPNVRSIIPLCKGLHSAIQFNSFDINGNVLSPDTILYIDIPEVYVFENDTSIIPFNHEIHDSTNLPFLFKYEYNNSNEGNLISYLTEDTLIKGIYVFGEYQSGYITLHKEPVLWLKYPGKPNDKWNYIDTDSSIITYELLNTNESFSIPTTFADDFSPIYTLDCYLYKSIKNNITEYFYYHPNYGMVGYLEYKNGSLEYSGKILSDY